MKKILLCFFVLLFYTQVRAQDISQFQVSGFVYDSLTNEPIPGALVEINDLGKRVITGVEGEYSLSVGQGRHIVSVSFLGFEKRMSQINVPGQLKLDIYLVPGDLLMESVEVVSTGYQSLPKERATGSFVVLDKELVNRRVSTNLIDRMEDVTAGMIFNRSGPASDPISIRGRNTIFANTMPLVIVDGFPYDGPLENINPNDVESITVLKDAAAASIWGARAGNGVIVVTTKQGTVSKPAVTFNSNINITESQDLFYRPQMSVTDVIEVEEMLFARGFYNASENSLNRPALSPVVETLIAEREGLISGGEAGSRIDAFRDMDSRRDLSRYYHRPSANQQYSLGITGGTSIHKYAISAGWDQNSENITGNSNSRKTLSINNNWNSRDGRLSMGLGVYYTKRSRDITTEVPSMYLYETLADALGNPLPIIQKYNTRYVQSEAVAGLLDWSYVPLDEIGRHSNRNSSDDYRLNLSLGYKVLKGLKVEVLYQYWQNNSKGENFRDEALFSVRDQINIFTQTNPDGSLDRAVPMGGILDLNMVNSMSHTLRSQASYSKNWGNHSINGIMGYEVKDFEALSNTTRYYGYDDQLGISRPVDNISRFRQFHNGSLATIFPGIGHSGMVDRFLSYYTNVGYSYSGKYLVTVSARKDASNLFGVESNQRAVPLWSLGGGWVISEEDFFNLTSIPYVKLRASYGYNGNIDKSLTAFTTAQFFTISGNALPSGELGANILNPSNPLLRWEKIRISNLALDFESRGGRLSGSVDVFKKVGEDLIGDAPIPTSTGFSRFRGNTANTESRGMDFELQTKNLVGNFKWQTNFMYSHLKEKVTKYFFKGTAINYLELGNLPFEGKPLFGMYSIPWAGLNPDTGDPMGFLDGEPSNSYSQILNSMTPESIQFHGSRRPTSFGAIRNTFQWNGFSLSINVSYRLGYYYRRESVRYQSILNGQGGHPDYADRWQVSGDEEFTSIPSMPSSVNILRDNIYNYSDILIERGDHIRLQDIRIAYNIKSSIIGNLPFRGAEIYTYANNLGILWKASKDPLDPDFRTMRPLRSIAAGIRLDF
ncbi:SusC/RagA family TonB-linked outer membrane protein [Belliella marina]|uniref:SusC/RagA family TonB-linked outer membrane protein n=1 Tax=Belliella marina TaxID=1644146 RepID=A0ABW4VRR2_9BACT